MPSSADIILALLIGFPLAAGVGILASYVLKSVFKSALKQAPLESHDKELELERIRAKERAEARALYERVVREKLDVMKTAITMGYDRQDLAALDARLEQLIGMEQLTALLADAPASPAPPSQQLLDTDLARESERLKRAEQQRD